MLFKFNSLTRVITATVILHSAVVHYPFLQKDTDIWDENLRRTLAVFAWATIVELLTEIAILGFIKQNTKAGFIKRWFAFILLMLGWVITCAVIIPRHYSLGHDPWDTNKYDEILYWNWIRAVLWILRVIILF